MGFLFGGSTQAQSRTVASGVAIQSSIYGSVVPVIYGRTRVVGNLIWYGDFQAIAQNSGGSGGGKGGGGGGGGKGGGGNTTYDYKASFLFALGEGTLGSVITVYESKTAKTWATSNLSFASGVTTQSPWGYLTSKHPAQALAYAGTGYVYAAAYDLGTSAQLPNLSYEVTGLFPNAIAGLPDANPAYVVADVLTNARYGVGFPSARLQALYAFSSYCMATGMVISPNFDQQQDAASLLNQIVQDCNSEFVWSGAQLTIVPYGDETITANGATYTAPSAALFSLTDDDFIETGAGDPVQVTRARPSDRMNAVSIEWLNRANHYNIEVVEAHDLAAIQIYGLRKDQPRQSHHFCNLSAATMSATLRLQRQAVRNVYSFTLGWKYIVLDPMDIVEISDYYLGLFQQWVRIISIEEDDTGNLKITAEEYLGGAGGAPLYSYQSGSPYIADYNVAPGSVNAPILFEPPPSLTGGIPQVWVGASGGANWGGADIWLSTDDSTYSRVGRVTGPARQGVLTATLSSGSDPDTANTLSVDLGESGGTLASGTNADADSYQTLCYVQESTGYELISYATATLTGPNAYNLTYLRRGAYGSQIGSHASGSEFCRLDNNIVRIDLPTAYIGQVIYLKLTSFNLWGGGAEQLSDVDAYSYSPSGVGAYVAPPSGIALSVGYLQQNDGTIQPYMQVDWTASPDPLFNAYEVEVSVHAANQWRSATVSANTTTHRIIPVPVSAGTAFDARVRAVRNGSGGTFFSAWDEVDNIATVNKTAASADPSGLTAVGGFQHISLSWGAALANDIAYYQIYRAASLGGIPTDVGISKTTSFVDGGLPNDTEFWYSIRSLNTSGVYGDWVGPVSATTLLVDTSGLNTASSTNAGVGTLASSLSGAGNTNWLTAISSFNVYLPAAGFVTVVAGFVQNYSGGSPPIWHTRLKVDGSVVANIGGGSFSTNPTIVWGQYMAAGTHSFEVDYAADTNGTLDGGTCTAQALFR
jgi:hypothetical protein